MDDIVELGAWTKPHAEIIKFKRENILSTPRALVV